MESIIVFQNEETAIIRLATIQEECKCLGIPKHTELLTNDVLFAIQIADKNTWLYTPTELTESIERTNDFYPYIFVDTRPVEDRFDARRAINELFPYFQNEMYNMSGDVALIMNMIQYGGAFKAIALKLDKLRTQNLISSAGYEYFLVVFNEQNIDLLTYLKA
jgi:hypothetical protein